MSYNGRKFWGFDSLSVLHKEQSEPSNWVSPAPRGPGLLTGNFISVLLDEVSNRAPRGSLYAPGCSHVVPWGHCPQCLPPRATAHFPLVHTLLSGLGPCLTPELCCGVSLVKPSRSVSLWSSCPEQEAAHRHYSQKVLTLSHWFCKLETLTQPL